MKYLKKYSDFITENKQQAASVLKKVDRTKDDPNFKKIKENLLKHFNSINYLGLMTKYFFTQGVSMDEIIDLMKWLKEHSKLLSKSTLKYKKFEDLKDEITQIDMERKAKFIYNLMSSTQKDLIPSKNEEFVEKAFEIHNIGLYTEFKEKTLRYKTKEELLEYMDSFIEENSESLKFSDIMRNIEKYEAELIWTNEENSIVLAEIFDYETSRELGSSQWCISTSSGNWDTYTKGTRRQFFIWDFNKKRSDKYFLMGFTTERGDIIYFHDKFDKDLLGKQSDVEIFKEAFEQIDFSKDLKKMEDNIRKLIKKSNSKILYDNNNIVIIKPEKNSINSLKQNDKFISSFETEGLYFYYNFNDFSSNKLFYHIYATKDEKGNIYLNIFNKGSKSIYLEYDNQEDKWVYNFNNNYEHYDIKLVLEYIKDFEDINSENIKKKIDEKLERYNRIKKVVNGLNVYNRPLNDDGFISQEYYNKEYGIPKTNYYAVVDESKNPLSSKYIRVISIDIDGNKDIKYNKDSMINKTIGISDSFKLDDDIKALIENGTIKPISEKEYQEEYNRRRVQFINKVENLYYLKDNKQILTVKGLYNHLKDNDMLGKSLNHFDEEDEDEIFKNYLIPEDYDENEYALFSETHITRDIGNQQKYTIIEENDLEEYIIDLNENTIEEVGISNNILDSVIDWDDVANDYVDEGEIRNQITNNPEYYDLEKTLNEYAIELIDKYNDILFEIKNGEDNLDKKEIVDNHKDFLLSNLDNFHEDNYKKENYDFENLIDEIENKITEIEEDYEYFEISEQDIDDKVEEEIEEKKQEILDEQSRYIENNLGLGLESLARFFINNGYTTARELAEKLYEEDGDFDLRERSMEVDSIEYEGIDYIIYKTK